ncbi:MAG: ABC transporter substrate-binding protein [Nocardioidaceae bacterium]
MAGYRKRWIAVGSVAALALALTACGSDDDGGSTDGGDGGSGAANVAGEEIILGTTDTVTALDPAGSYDLGSSTLEYSLYQTLLTVPQGENTPQGDAAESCTYDNPKTLTCTLKEGLKFSNGNELTSSDVKYSFERSLKIGDPNGAAIYLLGSIAQANDDGTYELPEGAIETPDDLTVVFHLNKPDTVFQFVLTYPGAGAIVDEETFPADTKLADEEIVGSGPYKLSQYEAGEQAVLEVNEEYTGENGAIAPTMFIQYFQESSTLKQAVEQGEVDIAWRSLSPTDVADLKGNGDVTVAEGDGAEIRYWVWKVDGQVGKNVAVRQAVAQLIDRETIAQSAYDGTVAPLYSIVPPGFPGQVDAYQEKYGEPNVDAAKKLLDDAGVSTPVDLTVGYTPTHYGPNAVDEATELQRQLNDSGLFNVELKSAEWEQYQTIYKEGAYDLFQLGWFPDYPDADTYLSPFMVDGGFFTNGYSSEEANQLVAEEQGTTDQAAREEAITKLQQLAAEDVPFVPSWVGKNTAIYGDGIEGVEETLDPAFIMRLWTLSKNA